MDINVLKNLGMTDNEIEVYLTLIRMGPLTVGQISEESGVHRTNIYAMLNKLENNGLVSHVYEGKKRFYKTTNPDNLLNYLKETESRLEEVIPELSKIRKGTNDKVNVYFFKNKSGMRSVLRDFLRDGSDLFAIGLSGQTRKYMPIFYKQLIRDMRKKSIKAKILYVEGINPPEYNKNFQIRFLPKRFFSPVYIWIYGDRTVISIWEPAITAVMIESGQVSKEYKKYFNLLWKIAKPPTV